MKKEIYQAAVRGNIDFLEEAQTKDVEAVAFFYNNDDLLGLTSHGNNIIHVAAKHGQLNFIKKALELIFPKKLICGTNLDGDTPLHLAAKQQTQTIVEHLITSYNVDRDDNEITSLLSLSSSSSSPPLLPPWRVQNKKGNTPLHVALMNGGKSIEVAAYLVGVDPEVASFVNHLKQTPLHLAVKYNNQGA
ncbi:uncharacterized protein LOC125493842 [Beta vulgaris subsp. vulgaris]|uniref:uncharacterized protein LOC125493842 n=1 Tax=Beta vulgaris subsp. vulgaris TaxID=3555 RepID=UPI0020371C71|nr:uncharacterized protein LOC125493842 [Beta vulgaris subsp. vulgaris]